MNVKQKGETRVLCPGSGRGSIPKLEPDFFNIGSGFLSFIMPILETFGYP